MNLKRGACGLVVFLVLCGGLSSAAPAAIPPVAQKMYSLFDQLRRGGPVHFQLSDGEINDYLAYSLRATPRPGLNSVTVKVFPLNYVSTYTVVDFDAVERWKPGTIPMLLKPVLNGKKSIWVDYRFRVNNAAAAFNVEKAYFGDIRLPALLVEKVIQILAARQPERYDTSKPVPLPFGLHNLWTQGNSVYGQK